MPADVRDRIARALQEARLERKPAGRVLTGPWQIRRHFAWAAVLVLLLAGMAVMSSRILLERDLRERELALRNLPPEDAFRSVIGRMVERRVPLQERSREATQLVSWLGDQGVDHIRTPEALLEIPAIGCSHFDGPNGKIGVVCFDADGDVVHLFIACARSMGIEESSPPREFSLHGRPALQWNDQENVYLMIPHDLDTDLPEVFL